MKKDKYYYTHWAGIGNESKWRIYRETEQGGMYVGTVSDRITAEKIVRLLNNG